MPFPCSILLVSKGHLCHRSHQNCWSLLPSEFLSHHKSSADLLEYSVIRVFIVIKVFRVIRFYSFLIMNTLLKQAKRSRFMGDLLRSKGFIWLATSNLYIGGWQQAGNILKIDVIGPWTNEIGQETTSEPQVSIFTYHP